MSIVVLGVFFTLQLILVVLDIWETHRLQRQASRRVFTWQVILFLAMVTSGFLGLQWSGGWLMPSPASLLESVRHTVASVWPTSDGTTLSIPWRLGLCVPLFYIAGFWDYAVHRYFSHSRWFWATHEYHHLPTRITVWMPGIFVRPFGFLPVAISMLGTAATVYGLLFVCGLPNWDLQPLAPLALGIVLVLTASHSAFLRRIDWVHRSLRLLFITSPQEHLLHHGIDSQGNYGNFTSLWDRLLGTYLDPDSVDLQAVRLGLAYDQDFLGTVTLGKLTLSKTQREKYQVAQFCNLEGRQEVQ